MDKDLEIQKLKEQIVFYETKLSEHQSLYYKKASFSSLLRYLAYQIEAEGFFGLVRKAFDPAKLSKFFKFISSKRK